MLVGCPEAKSFARAVVKPVIHELNILVREGTKAGFLGEVLPDEALNDCAK